MNDSTRLIEIEYKILFNQTSVSSLEISDKLDKLVNNIRSYPRITDKTVCGSLFPLQEARLLRESVAGPLFLIAFFGTQHLDKKRLHCIVSRLVDNTQHVSEYDVGL